MCAWGHIYHFKRASACLASMRLRHTLAPFRQKRQIEWDEW